MTGIFSERLALGLLAVSACMALVYVYAYARTRAGRSDFAEDGLHRPLGLGREDIRRSVRKALYVLAAVAAALSIARPLGGLAEEEMRSGGMDVIVVLDVSLSMAADEDGKPRIASPKEVLKKLVAVTPYNRYGLVTFAGDATVVCPLTRDQDAFLTMLDTEGPLTTNEPGSAMGEGILAALTRFRPDKDIPRAILVVSDGENTTGIDPEEAAQAVLDAGYKLYALGAGSEEGAKIPIARDMFGAVAYKQDRYGQVVISRLDEDTLKAVAGTAGGKYIHASDRGAVGSLRQSLNEKSGKTVESGQKSMAEYGPAVSLGAAGILLLSMLI